jgi:hypothetical protein
MNVAVSNQLTDVGRGLGANLLRSTLCQSGVEKRQPFFFLSYMTGWMELPLLIENFMKHGSGLFPTPRQRVRDPTLGNPTLTKMLLIPKNDAITF